MKTIASIAVPLLLVAASPAQDAASQFGHARTRELAELGVLPTPLEVAVADIVNFHRHRLPLPRAGEAVAMDLRFGADAVRPGGEAFLQVGFTTSATLDRTDLPPLNLALVVDCSGSMADAGKLDEVKRGLCAFADRLRRDDRVAIVGFGDEARVVASSRAFGDGAWFRAAVDGLAPGGSTNLHSGLLLGLQECARELRPRGSNRVILLTDGIANRGETDPEAILRDATRYTGTDVDLTTIGVGRDLNTALLDRLARGGRGLFHFVADGKDVAKVFVDEAEGLLAPAARRVLLRVRLPRGLDLLQVYGHQWRRDGVGGGDAIAIELPDMNRGMTAVVMLRCRSIHEPHYGERDRGGDDGGELRAEAELLAVDASAAGRPIELRQRTSLRIDERAGDPLADAEVKKNATIAALAQGMHDMAERAQDQRWAEAERTLQRAIDVARERLPNVEDPDVRAVLQMAEDHARTLRRHVDRFRDY